MKTLLQSQQHLSKINVVVNSAFFVLIENHIDNFLNLNDQDQNIVLEFVASVLSFNDEIKCWKTFKQGLFLKRLYQTIHHKLTDTQIPKCNRLTLTNHLAIILSEFDLRLMKIINFCNTSEIFDIVVLMVKIIKRLKKYFVEKKT